MGSSSPFQLFSVCINTLFISYYVVVVYVYIFTDRRRRSKGLFVSTEIMSKLKKLFSHISKYGHFRELDNAERDFFFFESMYKKNNQNEYRKENCEQSQTNKE